MLKFCDKYLLGKESYSLKISAIYVHIRNTSPPNTNVGSLNLAIGGSRNHHAVDLRTHWEKTNKDLTSYKMIIPFVFYFPLRLLLFGWRFCFFVFFFSIFFYTQGPLGNENKHENNFQHKRIQIKLLAIIGQGWTK